MRTLVSRAALLAGIVVVLDLLVKWSITSWLGPDADRHAWWIAGEWLGFEYLRNTGAAFGLFEGNPEMLAAVAVVITIGIATMALVEIEDPRLAVVASGLLAGGSIGNVIERIGKGYVTDFVAVGAWPRFNVADSGITVGVLVFAAALLWPVRSDTPAAASPEEQPRDHRA